MVTKKTLQSIRLDGGIYMDAHTANNEWKNEKGNKTF